MSLEFEGDTKEIAQKVLALVAENNKILHSIQRRARWGTFFHMIYWVLIIIVAAGSFYVIKPYYEQLAQVYQSMLKAQASIGNFPDQIKSEMQKYLPGAGN